jgi:hypothetical protein
MLFFETPDRLCQRAHELFARVHFGADHVAAFVEEQFRSDLTQFLGHRVEILSARVLRKVPSVNCKGTLQTT